MMAKIHNKDLMVLWTAGNGRRCALQDKGETIPDGGMS